MANTGAYNPYYTPPNATYGQAQGYAPQAQQGYPQGMQQGMQPVGMASPYGYAPPALGMQQGGMNPMMQTAQPQYGVAGASMASGNPALDSLLGETDTLVSGAFQAARQLQQMAAQQQQTQPQAAGVAGGQTVPQQAAATAPVGTQTAAMGSSVSNTPIPGWVQVPSRDGSGRISYMEPNALASTLQRQYQQAQGIQQAAAADGVAGELNG